MKKSIIIGLVLIVAGVFCFWWWHQPIKQFGDLAGESGQRPKEWAELSDRYPHLSIAFRIFKINPFESTMSDVPKEASLQAEKLYVYSSRCALFGLALALFGLSLPIISLIKQRGKRRSQQNNGQISSESALSDELSL